MKQDGYVLARRKEFIVYDSDEDVTVTMSDVVWHRERRNSSAQAVSFTTVALLT